MQSKRVLQSSTFLITSLAMARRNYQQNPGHHSSLSVGLNGASCQSNSNYQKNVIGFAVSGTGRKFQGPQWGKKPSLIFIIIKNWEVLWNKDSVQSGQIRNLTIFGRLSSQSHHASLTEARKLKRHKQSPD